MVPEINIGMVGHIDHGKTSLLKSLTGKWASTHSEEKKRGITIRLGYSEMIVYQCPEGEYTNQEKCLEHNKKCKAVRTISFVDAPGHETLMATMLSGASVMDAAVLVIAANEKCPQPQTKEHLAALNIMNIKDIIIVQNKVDLVNDEQAHESMNNIKSFVKGSVAESAPIIPISALHDGNLDVLIEAIQELFKTPKRDLNKPPIMLVSRSFDVNKPGSTINEFKGGVIGGILKQGKLKKGDEIIILPGLKSEEGGVTKWLPLKTIVESLFYGNKEVIEAVPGGNFGLSTTIDPGVARNDALAGSLACTNAHQPPVFIDSINLKADLMVRVVGTSKELNIGPLKVSEPLMINAFTAKTVGVINRVAPESITVKLKLPIAIDVGESVALSRFINNKWRLVGSGVVL
ncbi:MAG: translation initiation factor IF-2 subunit gamma [Candidatus Nanoarchaeia archaeon]|jgi:translation initiation factor 2 subunit 3